jgi:MoaA/NifB/PqqE/SkfB family radical SAM enzyme
MRGVEMITCFYALGGINYKNGVITTCPRQANQLVFANETILPSQIYNHKNFKDLRKLLYNNKWPSGCDTCEDMEKDNLKSMRQDYIVKNGKFFKTHATTLTQAENNEKFLLDCYDQTNHAVDFEGLRHVELRFSSACNFSCLHCSKVYSSGWTKKLQNYIPDTEVVNHDLRQLMGTEHRHGPNDNSEMSLTTKQALEIVEDLNENFPYVRYIDFAGGELLYQKQFFPTLRKLAEHPNAKNMHISFHTNFNADFSVEELTEVLFPFRESAIIISVDAGKRIYSYFRNGGEWDKLKNNIIEFKKINTFTNVDISCTTSIYQIMEIYDLFESFFELNCEFDASIVQTPKYINPSIIMFDFEKETLKDFQATEDLINRKTRVYPKAIQWFQYITDYVKNTKLNYNQFNRFLVYRKKSDEIWGQHFNDYFENYQIIDDELIRVK